MDASRDTGVVVDKILFSGAFLCMVKEVKYQKGQPDPDQILLGEQGEV